MIKQNEKIEIENIETPVSFRIEELGGINFPKIKIAILSIGYPKKTELYMDMEDISKMMKLLKGMKGELRKEYKKDLIKMLPKLSKKKMKKVI